MATNQPRPRPRHCRRYTKIPFETINSESAQASNLDAARQSIVLLKNGGDGAKPILPLKKGAKVALIGPHTQTQKDLAGNYFEDIGLGTCAGAGCVPMLNTAFDAVNTGGPNATVVAGCDNMKCQDSSGFPAAVAAAKAADVAVLALGIDGDICGEGRDRMDITLPGHQQQLAEMVIATGTPVVLLVFSGGLVDIRGLQGADIAIVQGWFPGATGGTAMAETCFGEQNRFGKLPFTWYAPRPMVSVPAKKKGGGGGSARLPCGQSPCVVCVRAVMVWEQGRRRRRRRGVEAGVQGQVQRRELGGAGQDLGLGRRAAPAAGLAESGAARFFVSAAPTHKSGVRWCRARARFAGTTASSQTPLPLTT